MKLLCFVFITLSLHLHANTTTPRDTFKTFLKAMVQIKANTGMIKQNYEQAISTLDLDHIGTDVRYEIGKNYANNLIRTIDKIKKVNYDEIPEESNSPIYHFDKRMYKNQLLEISLIKIDNKWLFSQTTLNSLELYTKALKKTEVAKGIIKLNQFADKVRDQLTPGWVKKIFILENWQWLAIIIALVISYMLKIIAKFIIAYLLSHYIKMFKTENNEKLLQAIKPLADIIFIFLMLKSISFLDLPPVTITAVNRILYIAMSVLTVWFAHKVIEYLAGIFKTKALTTDSKFDDILIPLLTKTAFVIVYLFGAVLVASSLTIDVTGIIAGLGIGGLAFAFAAKDTLANFFGSIMLVLDRPFDIGDVITAGDIEGVVDEVGFRSTRIRTFNDSIITISNGELMNRPIDNKGKRRFRRLVTTLGLEYDTPAEKIEAFCEGIRQIILSHHWTRKDNFHVYFNNFGASSLDIKLVVYWKTDDYSRELAEQHRLLIDILRLSKEIGVSFAFPTQTVHMYKEEKTLQEMIEDSKDAFHKAQQMAKNLTQKPLSLKNPRSNGEDKDQFGDNEFGN